MIFGVIVSIFSEIREKANFKENDQNNKCFILDKNGNYLSVNFIEEEPEISKQKLI